MHVFVCDFTQPFISEILPTSESNIDIVKCMLSSKCFIYSNMLSLLWASMHACCYAYDKANSKDKISVK